MLKKLASLRQRLKWLDPFTYVDILLEKYWPVKQGKKTAMQEIGYNAVYIISAFVFAFIIYSIFALALQTKSPIVIVVSESMQPVLYRGDVVFIQGLKPESIKAQEVSLNENIASLDFKDFGKAFYKDSQTSSIGIELESISINDENFLPAKNSDIIVYYSIPYNEQIIHRALLKIKAKDGTFILTKGDNSFTNFSFDQDSFCVKISQNQFIASISDSGNYSVKCFNSITKYSVDASKIEGKAVFTIPLLGCVKVWVFDNLPALISKGKMPSNYKGGFC